MALRRGKSPTRRRHRIKDSLYSSSSNSTSPSSSPSSCSLSSSSSSDGDLEDDESDCEDYPSSKISTSENEGSRPTSKIGTIRLLTVVVAALLIAVMLVQFLKRVDLTSTKRRRKGHRKAKKKRNIKQVTTTSSFCRSGIRPDSPLRTRMESFVETISEWKLSDQNVDKLIQKYGTSQDESGLVLELRRSFPARKVAGYFNCTECIKGGYCSGGRLSYCKVGYVSFGDESLPCDHADYKDSRCSCVKDLTAQQKAEALLRKIMSALQEHAASQVCFMRRSGSTSINRPIVYLHELPGVWMNKSSIQSLIDHEDLPNSDWNLAVRLGTANGSIKNRGSSFVYQSEISKVPLSIWCNLHLILFVDHIEFLVIAISLLLFTVVLCRISLASKRRLKFRTCSYMSESDKSKYRSTALQIQYVLNLWHFLSEVIRNVYVVIVFGQALTFVLLLFNESNRGNMVNYDIGVPVIIILTCIISGLGQLWITTGRGTAPHFAISAAESSPFKIVTTCLHHFLLSCMMPSWMLLLSISCFSPNRSTSISNVQASRQGFLHQVLCLVSKFGEFHYKENWPSLMFMLAFASVLCLDTLLLYSQGNQKWFICTISEEKNWFWRAMTNCASIICGTILLLRQMRGTVMGIAGLHSTQGNFMEELCMDLFLSIVVIATIMYGLCLIALSFLVHVYYPTYVLRGPVIRVLNETTLIGNRGVTEHLLASELGMAREHLVDEVIQCLSDLEWLGVALRDDETGGAKKTSWFGIPQKNNTNNNTMSDSSELEKANSLAVVFGRYTGKSLLPLFSIQRNSTIRAAQILFWRSFFSKPNWRGKSIHMSRAIKTHGRVLSPQVALAVFCDDDCCGYTTNLKTKYTKPCPDGWWDDPTRKATFHIFKRPISEWIRILLSNHKNVINPGGTDNVCTVGELEGAIPEFKLLPYQGKLVILYGLVNAGIATLDMTKDISDVGIIWS